MRKRFEKTHLHLWNGSYGWIHSDYSKCGIFLPKKAVGHTKSKKLCKRCEASRNASKRDIK